MINEATIQRVKSLLTPKFRRQLRNLSPQIQQIAKDKYIRWKQRPESLNFEPKFSNIYVIEITNDVHAISMLEGTVITWLWCGNYKNYSAELDALRKLKHK